MTIAPRVIIVIPTYNERENLSVMVPRLRALGIPGLSLLVVDDNSPDGTGRLADQFAAESPDFMAVVHRPGKLGMGRAYIQGFQTALDRGADLIIQMDADFSHPLTTIPVFLQRIADADVVVGSRYVAGSSLDEHWGPKRRALSKGGNNFARLMTGLPFYDVTGGFRCYRRSIMERIPLDQVKSEGFVFQVEMAYLAHRNGARFIEVPIHFADRVAGDSKMSLKIVWEAFWRVWDLRFRS